MASPFLYFAGERLSIAELSAARLDGDLADVGEGYMPADAVETPAMRAGSLRGLIGATLAATHVSAAWIHGARSEPPGRHTVQRAVRRRINAVIGTRLVYRDTAVDLDDLDRVGGVWVTTPVRTLADLVRVPDDPHRTAAARLAQAQPELCVEAISWLRAHRGVPNKHPGLSILDRWAAEGVPHEDVTR